jgi:hypothetical protein
VAIGKISDFTIYDLQYYSGITEVLLQNANVFNAASRNAIRIVPQLVKGQFEKTTFMKNIASLITRRDPTSIAGVVDKSLSQGEHVSVKVNRKIGPVAHTKDSFRKIASTPEELSLILGQQAGAAIAIDYVDTAIRSAVAATKSNPALIKNYATTTITHKKLLETMALFGDRASRIVCWVMHSRLYFDLVGQAIADKILNIADVAIAEGSTATLGKPTIISDSAALISLNEPSSSASDTYHVLGLTEDAIQLKESEDRDAVLDPVTGLENLVLRWQGEYAFNIGLKGYAYATGAGANPTDATLASSANWSQVVTDDKDCLGVMLNVKGA